MRSMRKMGFYGRDQDGIRVMNGGMCCACMCHLVPKGRTKIPPAAPRISPILINLRKLRGALASGVHVR